MKKLIIGVLLLLLIPSVLAYGGMDIEEIRVYVDKDRQNGVEEDGDDFYVQAGDLVDIIIEFYNYNHTVTEVKIDATFENIDDGEDITKDIDWFDVDADDDRSKPIAFAVPSDAREDDYDLTLEITYKYANGTQEQLEDITFEVTVRKESEKEKSINLEGSFDNLTNICGGITQSLNSCFGFINSSNKCESEMSTCREQKGVCTTDLNNYKEDYTDCSNERTDLKQQVQNTQNEMSTMITLKMCNDEVTDKEKQMQQYGLVGGLGIAAGLYFWNKKKKGENVAESYEFAQG